MALAKNSTAITQLTAGGTTASVSLATGISPVVALQHVTGTGTITAGGTAQIQYQLNGAARWYGPPTLLVTFGTTASTTEQRTVSLPDAATAGRIVYVAPAGAGSQSLDAEFGTVTP